MIAASFLLLMNVRGIRRLPWSASPYHIHWVTPSFQEGATRKMRTLLMGKLYQIIE